MFGVGVGSSYSIGDKREGQRKGCRSNKYQQVSTGINKYQQVSASISKYPQVSARISKHQQVSTSINKVALQVECYLSNTASFVLCVFRIVKDRHKGFAAFFTTFEEHLRWTSSVRQVAPHDG